MTDSSLTKSISTSRLARELLNYAAISLYLFVCFTVLLIYEDSQSFVKETTLVAIGVALVKALILGKFVLIGEALKSGTRLRASTRLHRIVWRTIGLMLVLIMLKFVEELVIGIAHGGTAIGIVGELRNQSWLSLLGPLLLMTLILIPLVTAIELNRALGDITLKELLLSRDNA